MNSVGDMWFTLGVRDQATEQIKAMHKLLVAVNGDAVKAAEALEKLGAKSNTKINGKKIVSGYAQYRGMLGKIDAQLSSIAKKKASALELGTDISSLKKAEQTLKQFRSQVVKSGDAMSQPYKIVKANVNALISEQDRLTSATRKANAENEKFAANMGKTQKEALKQNRTFLDLTSVLKQYASIFGASKLYNDIIKVGGQFEQQHIALQNILGDLSQANILFGQLKTLAIESPFTFLELSSYTKQLAAYSIPYEELFDTTKRLADMSAGLGVDMNRLILVYGQVRSAAVLRGQELRQFTEAGIPMVQKLADKFTELNGKLVTTGDVFELISRRKVPFEMVRDILFEMTNEGGQFYNMQEKLTNTTLGQAQKLKDSWEVMLGTLADSNNSIGALLKWILGSLSYVVGNLSSIAPTLLGFAGARTIGNVVSGIHTKYGTPNPRNAVDAYMSERGIESMNKLKVVDIGRLYASQQLTKESLRRLAIDNKHVMNLVAHRKMMEFITEEERKYILFASRGQIVWQKTLNIFKGVGKFIHANRISFASSAVIGIIGHIYDKYAEIESITKNTTDNNRQLFNTLDNIDLNKFSTAEEKINAIKSVLKDVMDIRRVEEHASAMKDVNEQYKLWKDHLDSAKSVVESMSDEAFINKLQDAGTVGVKWLKWTPMGETGKELADTVTEQYDETINEIKDWIAKAPKKVIDNAIQQTIADSKKLKNELEGVKGTSEKILYLFMNGKRDDLVNNLPSKYIDKSRSSIPKYPYTYLSQQSLLKQLEEISNDMFDKGTIKKKFFDKNIDVMLKNIREFSQTTRTAIGNEFYKTMTSIDGWRDDLIYKVVKPMNAVFDFIITPNITTTDPTTLLQGYQKYAFEALGGGQFNKSTGQFDSPQSQKNYNTARGLPTSISDASSTLNKELKSQEENVSLFEKNLNRYTDTTSKAYKLASDAYQSAKKDADETKKLMDKLGLDVTDGKDKTSNKTDTWLRNFNKRLANYERQNSTYERYRSLYGEGKARLRIGDAPNFVTDKEALYGEQLKSLKKAGLTTEDRKAKYLEIQNKLLDAQWEKEQKVAQDRISAVNKELDILKETYDTYKNIKRLTGDTNLAANLTGVTQNSTLESSLKSKLGVALGKAGLKYTAEEAIKMSDSEREKNLGSAEGVLAILKDIDDNTKKIAKDEMEVLTKAIESSLSLQQKQDANTQKAKEDINILSNKNIPEEQKKLLIANREKQLASDNAKLAWEDFKSKPEYAQAFENTDNLGIATIRALVTVLEGMMGVIKENPESMKSLQDSMDKLRDAMVEKSPFAELGEAYKDENNAKETLDYINTEYGKGYTGKVEFKKNVGKYKKGDIATRADVENDLSKAQSDFSKALTNCSKVVNNLSSAFSPLIDLFGGNGVVGTITSTLEQFNTTKSGVAGFGDAISGLGKGEGLLGDIGGAISGASPYIAAGMAALNLGSKIFGSLFKNEEMEKYEEMIKQLEDLKKIASDIQQDLSEDISINRSASVITKSYKQWIELQQKQVNAEKNAARQYLSAKQHSSGNTWEARMNSRISNGLWGQIDAELRSLGMAYTGSRGNNGPFDVGNLWEMSADQLKYIKEHYYDTIWINLEEDFRNHLDNIIEYEEELADITLQEIEALTGMTFDTIQSQWTELLVGMQYGSDEFADYFSESIRKTLVSGLIYDSFKGDIEKLLQDISKAREQNPDGTLSKEQLEEFRERYLKLVDDVTTKTKDMLDALEMYQNRFENMSFDSIQSEWTSMLSSLDYENRDFANSFEEYVKQAIVSSLIYDTYKSEINNLIDDMNAARKDGEQLTKGQYEEFKKRYEELMRNAANDVENLSNLYGWSSSKSSSLGGVKKSITEETADLLASYENAIRADVSIIRSIIPNINDNVIKIQGDIAAIQVNTLKSAISTESIESIIKQVTNGTKKLHIA